MLFWLFSLLFKVCLFLRDEEQQNDWLVTKWDQKVTLDDFPASDGCLSGYKCFSLTNGLISRRFMYTNSAWLTFDIFSHMRDESSVRALSAEAIVTLDSTEYTVGGISQTTQAAYWNSTEMEESGSIIPTPASTTFNFVTYDLFQPVAPFPWKPGTRHSPSDTNWPPKGLHLRVKFTCTSLPDLTLYVHYEMYESVPLMTKWISIHRGPGTPIDTHRYSNLRGHHYSTSKKKNSYITIKSITVESLATQRPYSPLKFEPYPPSPPPKYLEPSLSLLYLSTDQAHGASVHWLNDPRVSKSPGSSQPLGTAQYSPGVHLQPSGADFVSFRAIIFISDTTERERASLGRRRIVRTLAPTTLEAPLFFHLSKMSNLRTVADQLSEVGGFDMIIYSFGSGFVLETDNATYLSNIAQDVAYAKQRGIEVGGYDLICLDRGKGGYGGNVGDQWDVVEKDGKLGQDACFASGWVDKLLGFVDGFVNKTGLSMLETDGPYGGGTCYGTKHKYHLDEQDSVYHQERIQGSMYANLRSRNVFINQPDNYFFQGGSKTGIGYNEEQFSLPRWQDLTVTRGTIYDDTFDKIPTQGWSFVPIVDYHGGGAAAAFVPLGKHLKAYEFALGQHIGGGVAACYRGEYVYDDDRSKSLVTKWTSFWLRHRELLVLDIVHLRRAGGRGLDAFLHVRGEESEEDRAILMVFNGMTNRSVKQKLRVPLYYTGIADAVMVHREDAEQGVKMMLKRDYSIVIDVQLEPETLTWWTIKKCK